MSTPDVSGDDRPTYAQRQSAELAALIRWPSEPEPWLESMALTNLHGRLACLNVSPANYDPDRLLTDDEANDQQVQDVVSAYDSLDSIIGWAMRQQARLTGRTGDDDDDA